MKVHRLITIPLVILFGCLALSFWQIGRDEARMAAQQAQLCAVEQTSFSTLSWDSQQRANVEQNAAAVTPALIAAQNAREIVDKQEAAQLASLAAALKSCPP